MAEHDPSYRMRRRFPGDRERHVRARHEVLADLERQTDPDTGTAAEGKDGKAFSALVTAGGLIDNLAGWALDHVYGLSLAGRRMLSREVGKPTELEEYKNYIAAADSHMPEITGSLPRERDCAAENATERRLLLRNLIFAGGGWLPSWLQIEVVEALDALDRGEVLPILEAVPKKEGGMLAKTRLAEAQLEIVAVARFRYEVDGTTLEEAFAAVAAKSNGVIAEKTLSTWDARLNKGKVLGRLRVRFGSF